MCTLKLTKKSQVTLEYTILVGAIVSAVLFAAENHIKPAVIKMMEKSAELIEASLDKLVQKI